MNVLQLYVGHKGDFLARMFVLLKEQICQKNNLFAALSFPFYSTPSVQSSFLSKRLNMLRSYYRIILSLWETENFVVLTKMERKYSHFLQISPIFLLFQIL